MSSGGSALVITSTHFAPATTDLRARIFNRTVVMASFVHRTPPTIRPGPALLLNAADAVILKKKKKIRKVVMRWGGEEERR